MLSSEFKNKFNEINEIIVAKEHERNYSEVNSKLFSVLKLGEEFGELSEAVLTSLGHQRQEKIEVFDDENISKEIADVIIQTLVISHHFNVDIEKSVWKKLKIIKERYSKQNH